MGVFIDNVIFTGFYLDSTIFNNFNEKLNINKKYYFKTKKYTFVFEPKTWKSINFEFYKVIEKNDDTEILKYDYTVDNLILCNHITVNHFELNKHEIDNLTDLAKNFKLQPNEIKNLYIQLLDTSLEPGPTSVTKIVELK